jgi:hypothetical protein
MKGFTMNSDEQLHIIASSPNPISTLVLTIAGERAEAAKALARGGAGNGPRPLPAKTVKGKEIIKKMESVRRWPRFMGPFVMLVLTLRRQQPEVVADKPEPPALPKGALFVVRRFSR